jgi:hypothetical protein
MGFREKMMETMIGGMSSSEKQEMMSAMMERFFGSMTAEERGSMMRSMMPKMMRHMMGGGAHMMGKMDRMDDPDAEGSQERASGSHGPMDMCREMLAGMTRTSEMALHSTPEIQSLFQEWLRQIEEEFSAYLRDHPQASVEDLAAHFKLSLESVVYLASKLTQRGKLDMKVTPKSSSD